MQLILSIDDIGIKKNMSTVEETNQNGKEIKKDLINNILSYSSSNITDDSLEKQDKVMPNSQNSDFVHISNGTTTDNNSPEEVLDGSKESSKNVIIETANIEDHTNIKQIGDIEVDFNENQPKEIKTENEEDELQEKNVVETLEKQMTPPACGISEINCDINGDQDMRVNIKSETEDVDESQMEKIDVTQTKNDDQYMEVRVKSEIKDEEESHNKNKDVSRTEDDDQNMEVNVKSEIEDVEECHMENVDVSRTKDDDQDMEVNVKSEIEDVEKCQMENVDVSRTKDDDQDMEVNVKSEVEDVDESQIKNIDVIRTKDDDQDIEVKVKSETEHIDESQIKNIDLKRTKDDDQDMEVNVKSETEDTDKSQIKNVDVNKTKDGDESQKQDIDVIQKHNVDEKQTVDLDKTQSEDCETDLIENTILNNVENDSLEDIQNQHGDGNNTKDNGITCSLSDEIIDIADEKDSCDSTEDKRQYESKPVENIPLDTDSSNESTETQTILKNDTDDLYKSSKTNVVDKTVEISTLDKSNKCSLVTPENSQNKENTNKIKEKSNTPLKNEEPKNKLMNFKLSNTLNILSDDDEDDNTTKPESPKPEPEPSNKQCINIEDDDDIMLIDDESSTKENKIMANDVETVNSEPKEITSVENKKDIKDDTVKNLDSKDTGLQESTKDNEEKKEIDKPKEKIEEKSPLLSSNALKSFKKNLADMTREELEEFCILKIVESVFDRSNLGEIKSQLKVMAQNLEEYKNKAKMLSKQNRDLQVVLKSVQEEQKKNSHIPVTPLKITRSVGMQVLMTDKNSRKRQGVLNTQTYQNVTNVNNQSTATNNKNHNKSQVNQNTRNTKPQQQIPVPRLIPAVNIGTKSGPNTSAQSVNNPSKSPTVNNIPNGMKIPSPAPKPEKRTHNKMQQNNSVTVDLTDDEPPAKIINRNFNPPVRCVPPQSLLAPQRPPLNPSLNSPRKVYIPISGPQSQNIRPGQTIMLKSVSSQVPRPRGPTSNMKMGASNSGALRNARVTQRHPAPLPDFMKQYQPPNWKALPPAPELKLAKVENGIVISWKIDGYREENHEEIASYQLFAYQETSSPPNTSLWKKIGDVKALPLPMACTLTQFMSGYKYYFAVRAVDVRSRFGPFSLPGSILLLKN